MKFCSIIICHFGQTNHEGYDGANPSRSDIMKRSLESLKENTDYPAEVIVVDNGGNPDDTDYLVQKVREGVITTLIRNRDNMSFAFAWNQGVRLATGDYLCFTCNDIEYKKGWLSSCIELLEKYPNRKFISTPYLTPDKDVEGSMVEPIDGNRVNRMAGSNCMIMTYETFKDIGEFPHHRIAGSTWHRVMNMKGYMVLIPPIDLVDILLFEKGAI